MTGTLVSSWAFSPWRHDAARTAAAWLEHNAPGPLTVVRADLSALAPRATPRPAIDSAIRASISLSAPAGRGDGPPRDWQAIETYAESAHRAIREWRGGGGGWDRGYSGPIGLVDHLLLAILREQGVLPRWIAHVDDLPTHLESGALGKEHVLAGGLLTAAERILTGAGLQKPASGRVADFVLALVAARADEIVVGGEELRDALLATPAWAPHRTALAPRLRVWARPALAATVAGMPIRRVRPELLLDSSVPVRIAGWVPAGRHHVAAPVVQALSLLAPDERAALSLTLATDDPAPLAALLRDFAVEDAVELTACLDRAPDYALVVDRPVPEGLAWSPRELPELADWRDLAVPVILLAPQDAPLTRAAAAHHLPTDHVSAARALLANLAAQRARRPRHPVGT